MILALILLLLAAVGMVFQVAAARLVGQFATLRAPLPTAMPPVTILKPLCGAEPGLLDNLRSFWRQPWPRLRMVCGVGDGADPAIGTVRKLQAEFPDGDIRLVVGGPASAANAKVANLMNMAPHLDEGVVIVADSDMEAPPDLIPALVAALDGPRIGLATCLYSGHAAAGIWSRLGAMGINHGFLPQALLARVLGRKDGCFGAAMALPRATLDKAGGFAPLADRLADDYALGQRVRALGLEIALTPLLVRAQVHETGFSGLLAHEIRWARTIAALAPFSYMASVVMQPVALALLGNLAAGFSGKAPLVLAAAVMVRMLTARMIDTALGVRSPPPWLLPLRDGLTLAVFTAAFCGRSVQWRGRRYRIGRHGTLIPRERTRP